MTKTETVQPTKAERIKGMISLAILVVLLALAGSFVWTVVQSGEQPLEHEQMTVIDFGMGSSYTGSEPIVRVRDNEGLEHPISAPANIGDSCKIGDSIAIIRQGLNLQV